MEPPSEDFKQIAAMLEQFREEMRAAFAQISLRLDSIIAQLDRVNAKGHRESRRLDLATKWCQFRVQYSGRRTSKMISRACKRVAQP